MSELPIAPASERNKYPILEQLTRLLPDKAKVLEIGSGWGQHAVFFCAALPGLDWQTSECPGELKPLSARIAAEAPPGVRQPLVLDVLEGCWPKGPFDVVYTANTAHIMSWEGVEATVSGTSGCLAHNGMFIVYGPFNEGGRYTSDGNRAFDADLKARSPDMGLRDREALESLAVRHQMYLVSKIDMPANNMMLVFERKDE